MAELLSVNVHAAQSMVQFNPDPKVGDCENYNGYSTFISGWEKSEDRLFKKCLS